MAARDEIVWRSGVVYFTMAFIAVAVLLRIVILQYVERSKWEAMSEKYVFKTAEIPANRGDILAVTGGCWPVPCPFILFIWIPEAPGCRQKHGRMGSTDYRRAGKNMGVHTAAEWKSVITVARRKGDRYFLIKRRVDFEAVRKLKELRYSGRVSSGGGL